MNYIKYLHDFIKFNFSRSNRFTCSWNNRRPQLNDDTIGTHFDAHYIYHPAWAARVLAKTKPKKHVDISSILSFGTLISAFIPVDFYDFRPVDINLSAFKSDSVDLTALPFKDESIASLSCMHTIEHIGLGRYGDPIDPDGDLKAIVQLKRVVAPKGNLLIVVPIGKPRLLFNAHRIYSYGQIIKDFAPLKLKEFSLVTDNGEMIINATEELADMQSYGCGCFWFRKL